jgi:hypothetical protein
LKRALLRSNRGSIKNTSIPTDKQQQSQHQQQQQQRLQGRRKLPGYFDQLSDPGSTGAIIVIVIVVLFLLCCCRGMLCDILACVCLYEICCDDGAIGGFDLMPL